jgi:hypothetical protein
MHLKRINVINDNEVDHHLDDCVRIALSKHGYLATLDQSRELWERYSTSMEAGWMILPEEDSEIISRISGYFETEEEIYG